MGCLDNYLKGFVQSKPIIAKVCLILSPIIGIKTLAN